jgi:hypothetical protein
MKPGVWAALLVERDELPSTIHTLPELEPGDLPVGAGDVPIIAAVQVQPLTPGIADGAMS